MCFLPRSVVCVAPIITQTRASATGSRSAAQAAPRRAARRRAGCTPTLATLPREKRHARRQASAGRADQWTKSLTRIAICSAYMIAICHCSSRISDLTASISAFSSVLTAAISAFSSVLTAAISALSSALTAAISTLTNSTSPLVATSPPSAAFSASAVASAAGSVKPPRSRNARASLKVSMTAIAPYIAIGRDIAAECCVQRFGGGLRGGFGEAAAVAQRPRQSQGVDDRHSALYRPALLRLKPIARGRAHRPDPALPA